MPKDCGLNCIESSYRKLLCYMLSKTSCDVVLLFRCLLDTDDEVRDRATFYVNILKEKEKALSSGYILNGRN